MSLAQRIEAVRDAIHATAIALGMQLHFNSELMELNAIGYAVSGLEGPMMTDPAPVYEATLPEHPLPPALTEEEIEHAEMMRKALAIGLFPQAESPQEAQHTEPEPAAESDHATPA